MAVVQSTYSETYAVGFPGMVANGETSNRISRTVESAAGIAFGQPAFRGSDPMGCVVGGTQAGTAAGSESAGNTGTGTVTDAPTVAAGAKAGRYIITITEPGTNLGTFQVEDPDGIVLSPSGVVGTEYDANGLTFTVADGTTDFVAGDQLYIDVTFTANADFLGITMIDKANPVTAANASTPDKYPRYATAAIMTHGVIYVTCGDTVADGADVYWDPSDARFTDVATHVKLDGWKFDDNGVDGDVLRIAKR